MSSSKKRSVEDGGDDIVSKKKIKFDKDDVARKGFCTHPDKALTPEEVECVVSGTGTTVYLEKDFVGKGTRRFHCLDRPAITLVFYFDGKKFVKKDRERFQTMVDAVANCEPTVIYVVEPYLLLSENADICKRNTLPELYKEGYVVQRVG